MISELSDSGRRKFRACHLGFVLQFGDLINELTLLENAALPALMRGATRRAGFAEAKICLQEVGLENLTHRLPQQVSGGERQRGAIARALVGSPSFILADEPTGSLDSSNSELTLRLLLDQARLRHAGVLVVTHDRSHLDRYDRLVQMSNGLVMGAETC